jgi:MFS family permease
MAQGLGNLIEDGLGWEWGVWGFFIGGVGMLVTLALAGILAQTVRHSLRWSGVFLILGATGAMLGLGLLIMGLTWIALSYWIRLNKASRRPDQP